MPDITVANTNAHVRTEVEWNVRRSRSCIWTWRGSTSLVICMDDDTADLVLHLCTRIGMIMEDTSVMALTIANANPAETARALEQLGNAAGTINAMVRAAQAVHRQRVVEAKE